MADCQLCEAFLDRILSRYAEWAEKASFEELMRANADVTEYHCPECKADTFVIALVKPQ